MTKLKYLPMRFSSWNKVAVAKIDVISSGFKIASSMYSEPKTADRAVMMKREK